jgi:hypothetical protein
LINFKLKEIDEIVPFGEEPALSLHWFGLTDGDLWLRFGNETIYEYSREAIEYFGNKPTPYVDYQLSRFVEDFSGLFGRISETVPEKLYLLTDDLENFRNVIETLVENNDTGNNKNYDLNYDIYDTIISWIDQRTMDSGHLIGGPNLSFFRRNDKVRIVWETDDVLENGLRLWTAKSSSVEMNYDEFLNEIETFGRWFFEEMGKQVERALTKELGNIVIDKQMLENEQKERKECFFNALFQLQQPPIEPTDWIQIERLITQITKKS